VRGHRIAMAAAALIVTLPVLLLTVFAQRQIVAA
jgi:ABC-type glycerol-3-phosphate transport system permease component